MTTTESTTKAVEAARRFKAEQAARVPEAQAAAARAEQARLDAEAAEAEALAATAGLHPIAVVSSTTSPMLDIGRRLDEARAAAVAAVLDPTADPVRAWVTYRTTAATLAGEWAGYSNWAASAGARTPPGPMHRVPPLPAPPGTPPIPNAEGLSQFLENAVRSAVVTIERDATNQANRAWWSLNEEKR